MLPAEIAQAVKRIQFNEITGPERIEAGWFDDAFASRDYHVAVNDDVCCWIYRERRSDTGLSPGTQGGRGPSPRWFLHGFFG